MCFLTLSFYIFDSFSKVFRCYLLQIIVCLDGLLDAAILNAGHSNVVRWATVSIVVIFLFSFPAD